MGERREPKIDKKSDEKINRKKEAQKENRDRATWSKTKREVKQLAEERIKKRIYCCGKNG